MTVHSNLRRYRFFGLAVPFLWPLRLFRTSPVPVLWPFRLFQTSTVPVYFYYTGSEPPEQTGIVPVKTGTVPFLHWSFIMDRYWNSSSMERPGIAAVSTGTGTALYRSFKKTTGTMTGTLSVLNRSNTSPFDRYLTGIFRASSVPFHSWSLTIPVVSDQYRYVRRTGPLYRKTKTAAG